MKYLSKQDIHQIAERVLRRYHSLVQPESAGPQRIDPLFIAQDIMKLTVEHASLSEDGSILGATSYGTAAICIYEESEYVPYWLDGRTILIEKSLHTEGQTGRYHFTVAHELSHQILKLLFPKEYGLRYRKSKAVIYRDNRQRQLDREEWQADALAVELLMPAKLIHETMQMYGLKNGIRRLNRIFDGDEYKRFSWMANYLGVSKEALAIRLQDLGLLKENELKNPYAVMDIYV